MPLTSAETKFDVGVSNLEMMKTVVVYGAMAARWKIEQTVNNGLRVSYKTSEHLLKCDVVCDFGQCRIVVVEASRGLKFDPSKRELHRNAIRWIQELKSAIVSSSAKAQHPFEVPPTSLSVASGVDLKTVIAAVCKAHNMVIQDLSQDAIRATLGEGPERCQLKIFHEKMLFSIRHDRPKDAQTNGFQYDFLIKDLRTDIISFADPKLSEMKRRTQQISRQFERLINAVNSVESAVDSINTRVNFSH